MLGHHEVFSRFQPFRGVVTGDDFGVDYFLGIFLRRQFRKGMYTHIKGTFVQSPHPEFDEEYFEWIDLLESIVAAKGSFTMIELGAGFGRWSVRAACALKQYPHLPYRLIAVEAEPVVFQWMHSHFADNGIDPDKHSLIHAAVCSQPGDVLFYIGGPRGGPYDRTPDDWYGQFLAKGSDLSSSVTDDGEYAGFKVRCHESGWRSIRVPGVTLTCLLQDLDLVDLIDMDIEGQELPSVRETIEQLNVKVKRLHIGTHSQEIEAGLRELLNAHGWICLADYPLFSVTQTPWGSISFENGVQSWVNPRL